MADVIVAVRVVLDPLQIVTLEDTEITGGVHSGERGANTFDKTKGAKVFMPVALTVPTPPTTPALLPTGACQLVPFHTCAPKFPVGPPNVASVVFSAPRYEKVTSPATTAEGAMLHHLSMTTGVEPSPPIALQSMFETAATLLTPAQGKLLAAVFQVETDKAAEPAVILLNESGR